MQTWLKEWFGRTHKPAMVMGGMRMMEKLKGEAFEKEYLSMMIRHHASAVRQAKWQSWRRITTGPRARPRQSVQ